MRPDKRGSAASTTTLVVFALPVIWLGLIGGSCAAPGRTLIDWINAFGTAIEQPWHFSFNQYSLKAVLIALAAYALCIMLYRDSQRKRRPVAGNQQFLLSALPAMPARPHRVNDVFAGQSIALCDLCAACFAPMQRFALRQQLRACGAVNAAIHPSAAQQRFIGGVDNGVHLHPGNIVSDDLQRHKALSTFLSV